MVRGVQREIQEMCSIVQAVNKVGSGAIRNQMCWKNFDARGNYRTPSRLGASAATRGVTRVKYGNIKGNGHENCLTMWLI